MPDAFKVTACHQKNLSPASLKVSEEDKCKNVENVTELQAGEWAVHIKDMAAFAEYSVEIIGTLSGFRETRSAQMRTRTSKFAVKFIIRN